MAIQADGGAPATPLKTLIVSRDRVAAVLAARLLEKLGHARPERVESLVDAQAQVHAAAFDILLVDADLLAAGGRDWLPAAGGPRVIAMSATPGDVGADAHLLKPLSLEPLAEALKARADGVGDEMLRLFGHDGLLKMVGVLERDLPQLEVVLGEALDGEDRSGLRRQAHTLRGVAQQLGAHALADHCTATEAAGRDAPWPQVVAGVRTMLAQYKAVVRQLRERLNGG